MTKHFQRCPADSKRFRSFILSFGAAAIWLLATLTPDAARAGMTTDQAVDVTMQVFVAISGVPIPPGTADVLSGMLVC
jgi:hypothetical protein